MFKQDKTLLLATHNDKKLSEVRQMLAPLGITVKGVADFDLPEPEETGVTFAENAFLKAEAAAKATGLPALADDSGFCAEALYGGPGIYSARFADELGGWIPAMNKVLESAKGRSRKCWFVCSLCLVHLNTKEKYSFEGIVKGSLAESRRGEKGFGYDPIFIPEGYQRTYGEMEAEEKNALSHRRIAIEKFLEFLRKDEKTPGN